MSSYATRSERASPEIQQPTELSFAIIKESEKLKDDNIDVYVPYPTESVISQNALGQPPGFTDLAEPIAPFGVTLSDLTHMRWLTYQTFEMTALIVTIVPPRECMKILCYFTNNTESLWIVMHLALFLQQATILKRKTGTIF